MVENGPDVGWLDQAFTAAAAAAVAAAAKSLQSCPTLCDPMDCSLPDSPIYGIFQARVLEWGAIAFSEERHKPIQKRSFGKVNTLSNP